jgi:hypothetical protein
MYWIVNTICGGLSFVQRSKVVYRYVDIGTHVGKKADQQQRNQSCMNDELKRRYIKLTQIFLTHLNQVVILSAI